MRNCQGLATTLAGVFTVAASGAAGWLAYGWRDGWPGQRVPLVHPHLNTCPRRRRLLVEWRPGSQIAGSDVMALVVAGLAVSAFVFLIVTFLRRRTPTA